MQQTGNKIPSIKKPRLTIRVSRTSMMFSVPNVEAPQQVEFEPYEIKNGISPAANLRQAFLTSNLLRAKTLRARLMIDEPALMIPIEEYSDNPADKLYSHSFTMPSGCSVAHNVVPELNTVAVYALNKDLKMVVTDHFDDVRYCTVAQPVYTHLYRNSFAAPWKKLYAYFHDDKMELMAFRQNRFRFINQFATTQAHDALYYIMAVWQTLGMNNEQDEIHLVGSVPEADFMVSQLRTFVQKAFVVNPVAHFNRSPLTRIEGMPFDLMCLYLG